MDPHLPYRLLQTPTSHSLTRRLSLMHGRVYRDTSPPRARL
ncbi:hypothetical protein SAMN05216581_1003 [Pseudomonas asplenii]|uniref:Uncharacterized protein n=1 Tax=Pseudomonas asplenii TaxID=53407 RepID=A0A1H6MAW8_9PSED|nr:hypothetical protein SAMN05216581_1003 [Pseudomonas fuscovaginae]